MPDPDAPQGAPLTAPQSEEDVVIVNDERVGGTGAVIGDDMGPYNGTDGPIMFEVWQGQTPNPGELLMTRSVAEASGYTERT